MMRYLAGRRDTLPELRPTLLSKNPFEQTGCQADSPISHVVRPCRMPPEPRTSEQDAIFCKSLALPCSVVPSRLTR